VLVDFSIDRIVVVAGADVSLEGAVAVSFLVNSSIDIFTQYKLSSFVFSTFLSDLCVKRSAIQVLESIVSIAFLLNIGINASAVELLCGIVIPAFLFDSGINVTPFGVLEG